MQAEAKKKQIINVTFWIVLYAVILIFLRIMGMTPGWIPLLCVWGFIAVFYHFRKQQKDDSHLKKIFALDKYGSDTNIYEYDVLRVTAVCFVIITHALQTDIAAGVITDPKVTIAYTWAYIITLSCNLIYVMLSGALLLPWKEQSIPDFYVKRLVRVLLPMIVFDIWYLWILREIYSLSVGEFLKRIYLGATPEAPHFWLLYVIMGIYIAIPFLRYMFKYMNYKTLTVMVVLSLIAMGLVLFIGKQADASLFLASWIAVAVMGYWVTQKETEKYYVLLTLAGIASAAVILLFILSRPNYVALSTNCSPFMCLITLGIFSIVMLSKKHLKKLYIITLFSQYSYPMILIHWWVLHGITIGKFNMLTNRYHYWGILLSLIITLVISFIAGFMLDNLVCKVLIDFIDWIYAGIKKIIANRQ